MFLKLLLILMVMLPISCATRKPSQYGPPPLPYRAQNLNQSRIVASVGLNQVTVYWLFEHGMADALQISTGGDWTTVPGPYHLTPNQTEYEIPVLMDSPMKLFRVVRNAGSPWLYPNEIPPTP